MPTDLRALNGIALIEPHNRAAWQELLDTHGLPDVSVACFAAGTPATLARVRERLAPEHPPTDHLAKPPPAIEPKGTAMADPILARLADAVAKYGAKSAFAKAIGRAPGCVSDWTRAGRIPDEIRPAVEAWLDKNRTERGCVYEMKDKANPTAPTPARLAAAARATDESAAAALLPPGTISIRVLMNAIGLTPVEVWVRSSDGVSMRKANAIVLDA